MTGFYFKHGLIVTQGQFKEKHFLEVNVVSEFIPPNSLKKWKTLVGCQCP